MLKRLFPNMAEWPTEKWLGVPVLLLWGWGCLAGILDLAFGRIP